MKSNGLGVDIPALIASRLTRRGWNAKKQSGPVPLAFQWAEEPPIESVCVAMDIAPTDVSVKVHTVPTVRVAIAIPDEEWPQANPVGDLCEYIMDHFKKGFLCIFEEYRIDRKENMWVTVHCEVLDKGDSMYRHGSVIGHTTAEYRTKGDTITIRVAGEKR